MRVLLISHTCQSRREGQPRALELAKFDDIELCVLAPQRFNHYGPWREAEVPENPGFTYRVESVRFPWLPKAQNYLHYYPALSSILTEFRPDIIDLWEETWSLCSVHACYLRNRKLPSAKIVAETEQNINKNLRPPFESFRSYVLKNADYCIGRGEEAVRHLCSKGYQGPAASVPNAVDAELFRPMDRAACRRELGLSGFVAGYIGRLVEEKGVFDMVEALPHCDEEVNLVFGGDGPVRAGLEERVQQLKVPHRVTFLPHRPLDELPVVMNALDVLVLPSRTTATWKEQFGRVLIEAQACATPNLGSDSGAIPDVVGEAGIIVPEANPQALAEGMDRMRSDLAATRQMGESGRRQVEEHYTWACVARRMRDIYHELLATPG